MKKTLLVSAIAAATFSGAVAAQESLSAAGLAAKMDAMPTVYGNIQYVVTHTDVEDGSSELAHSDNGSTIGLKHDHEIAPGVTAFLKLELEGINADNKAAENGNAGLNELDEAYIGIKGDSFGQVWVGSDDSQFENLINYTSNYYEVAALSTSPDFTTGEGDLVQYISPSFGGFTLHGAVAIQGDGDPQYDEKAYPYQLGARFSADMLTIAAVVDSNDGDTVSSENTYAVDVSAALMDNVTVGALYSTRGAKTVGGATVDNGKNNAQVYANYTIGANVFNASYEMAEQDKGDEEATVFTLQALHNISDNMYVYTEGYLRTDETATTETDTTQLALGAVYYF